MANPKKKIAIITANYPYGETESFLHNEILYLAKYFDIELYPISKNDINDVARKLPINVKYNKPFLSKNKKERIINGFFNYSPLFPYLKDIIILLLKSNNIGQSFLQWFTHFIAFRPILSSKFFVQMLNNNNYNIIYFYWANIPINLIKDFNNKTFIRVHGAEVDFIRANNYICLIRHRIVSNNSITYLPISDNSFLNINKINNNTNSIISRIGVYDNGLNRVDHNEGLIRIVSCSNVIPLKRIHLIINSLHNIIEKKIEWIHFGDGFMMNEILNLSKKIPQNINVVFKGRVDNDLVIKFYKENYIDLFINVSEVEGVPVSIMEAFSFGIPCFATDVGGTSEIVNDSNGFLVKKNFKLNELERVIINIKETSKIKELRENSRKTWNEKCNAKKNFEDLVNIFNNN